MAKLLGFENINFIFGKAMGCLGRWLIAKYRFSRFEH